MRNVRGDLILFIVFAIAAALFIMGMGGGCCKSCPPPKVIVETRHEPCLEKTMLEGLMSVTEPAACNAERSQEECLRRGCLPGKVCYDAKNHGALLFNLKTLLSRIASAEALCLKTPVPPSQ